MMSVELQSVMRMAEEIDSKLTVYNFPPDRCVRVINDEGCTFFYVNAFLVSHGKWKIVFAEHHNPVAFHDDDSIWVSELKLMDSKQTATKLLKRLNSKKKGKKRCN